MVSVTEREQKAADGKLMMAMMWPYIGWNFVFLFLIIMTVMPTGIFKEMMELPAIVFIPLFLLVGLAVDYLIIIRIIKKNLKKEKIFLLEKITPFQLINAIFIKFLGFSLLLTMVAMLIDSFVVDIDKAMKGTRGFISGILFGYVVTTFNRKLFTQNVIKLKTK